MATIKDYVRYCKAHERSNPSRECPSNCELLGGYKGVSYVNCNAFMCCETERAEKIVDEWCAKHPVKTYKDDFFKKLPKALKAEDDTPFDICVNSAYGTEFPCGYDCKDCWNQVYKEEEE